MIENHPVVRSNSAELSLAHGILPMPLKERSKEPTQAGWQKRPAPSPAESAAWCEGGNIGFRTGTASGGLVVIDIDPGADPALAERLPTTVAVETGRTDPETGVRGRHLYFRSNKPIRCSTGKLAPKVDVRADGGYVVAPGSIHPDTGLMYRWADGRMLGETPIADLPPWVEDALTADPAASARGSAPACNWPAQVPLEVRRKAGESVVRCALPAIEGQGGDSQTYRVACDLVIRCGLEGHEAIELLRRFNERCSPPWSESQLRHKVDEASKLLATSSPADIGRKLADSSAEVLKALGIERIHGPSGVTVRRGTQSVEVPKTKAKALPKAYSGAIAELAPELPPDLVKAAGNAWASTPAPHEEPPTPFEQAKLALASTPADIAEEAERILHDQAILDRAVAAVGVLGFDPSNQEHAVKAVLLGQLVRLSGESSHVLIMGETGEGKSELALRTSDLQPPEFKLSMTSFSELALVYMGRTGIAGKILVCGERRRDDGDGNGVRTAVVRQLVSENTYTHRTVGEVNGQRCAEELRIDGPTSIVETTTAARVFREDDSRMIRVPLRSTVQQREMLLERIYQRSCGLMGCHSDIQRTKAVWNTVLRRLHPQDVVMPPGEFARLKALVDVHGSDAKRRMRQLLALIKAHAILHQFQRQRDADGRLQATTVDVDAVIEVMNALRQAAANAGVQAGGAA